MGYLLAEIVLYLVGAGLVGFVVGWFVRGGFIPVSLEKNSSDEVSVDSVDVIKKDEPKVSIPTLLTEAPTEGIDKLSLIKGIGPVIEKQLNELGIYSFEQMASWTPEEELWIGTQMAFPNKVSKEEWVKQAKELLENK